MIKAYALKIDENIDYKNFIDLLPYISGKRREDIKRLYRFEDAQRSLLAELLIRYVVSNELKVDNSKISFYRNTYGKPFLVNVDRFYFNTSHSGKWVVASSAYGYPTGIDVELIRPMDMNIAKNFFSRDEYRDLINKNEADRLAYFFELWTLKESYIKAIGKGFAIPFDSFSIFVSNKRILFQAKHVADNWYFKQYAIETGYKMAICAATQMFSDQVEIIMASELCTKVQSVWKLASKTQ